MKMKTPLRLYMKANVTVVNSIELILFWISRIIVRISRITV